MNTFNDATNLSKNIVKQTSSLKKNLLDKNTKNSNKITSDNLSLIKYHIGEPYYIEGVKYIPIENYKYNEIGLASFYGKDLHNTKTVNNDYNKVTEILGRHKTLPIPSIVKITNLENGLSLVLKINDRHNDNASIIQVSRKTAQLLRFYKNKIAKVNIRILSDPSKQIKIVTQSINEESFNDTIVKAPTEDVLITNLDDTIIKNQVDKLEYSKPVELGFEEPINSKLFIKILGFLSYDEAKNVLKDLQITNKFLVNNSEGKYSLIVGPLENIDANKLVLSFIAKGYKDTEIILE